MPFSMQNAPATFQRLINTITAGLNHCSAYQKDIVIRTTTWDEHIKSHKDLFSRLANAGLTVTLAKCEFVKTTASYLGKEVGHSFVRVLSDKVQAVADFPVPRTRRALIRFLGMSGY